MPEFLHHALFRNSDERGNRSVGLDGTANIRFGLDYGVLDGLSIGVGKSRFDRLFDFRTKASVLRQTSDDRIIHEKNNQFALGIGARWALNQRFAIVGEYIPVVGNRSAGTHDTISLGLDIDTGGHVFQLFFTTTQWFTEQHSITRNTDDFFKGNFRFGFNVNRVFGLIH